VRAGIAEHDGDVMMQRVVTRPQGVGADGERALEGEEEGEEHGGVRSEK
jgi:hypothetical protein